MLRGHLQYHPGDVLESGSNILENNSKSNQKEIEIRERAKNKYQSGLYFFSINKNTSERELIFNQLPISNGRNLNLWLPMVLNISATPVAPFVDPRRSSKGLTQIARQFVFSVMHERIRAADPDFEDVRLAIFRFRDQTEGHRSAILHDNSDIRLFF